MISFEELDKRIKKQYPRVLQAHVRGEQIFPLFIRADKTGNADFVTRNKQLEQLYANSSHHHPLGYIIETATVHRRQHGTQDEPVAFYFDTLERYLGYIGEVESFRAFVADNQLILESFIGLKRKGNTLSFAPCIPAEWPSLKLKYKYIETMYYIEFLQSHPGKKTTIRIVVDGVEENDKIIFLKNDGQRHEAKVFLDAQEVAVEKPGLDR